MKAQGALYGSTGCSCTSSSLSFGDISVKTRAPSAGSESFRHVHMLWYFGLAAHRRVSVERSKPCTDPRDRGDMLEYLPDGLTQYILNNKKKIPPISRDPRRRVGAPPAARGGKDQRHGDQSLRGRGGVIAVMCKTHWTGLFRPSWEREMDLQLLRQQILLSWPGIPNKHRQTSRLYRQLRIGAAPREPSRAYVERYLAPGYGCVPRADWLRHCCTKPCPPMGPISGTKPMTACGG